MIGIALFSAVCCCYCIFYCRNNDYCNCLNDDDDNDDDGNSDSDMKDNLELLSTNNSNSESDIKLPRISLHKYQKTNTASYNTEESSYS